MSCQQVPRLAEDPYTFTEPPATTTFFTSPVQKLTTIKSANALSQHQKHSSSRYNGYSPIGNGLSNTHHTPVYAKQPIYQQHSQANQQQQAKVAKQISLPPPPLYSTAKASAKTEHPKTVHNTLNHSTGAHSSATGANTAISAPASASNPQISQQKSSKQTQQRPTFKQPTGLQSGVTGSTSSGSVFQSIRLKGDAKVESSQSINGITANGVGKGKKIGQSSGQTFVKPNLETKLFVGKKLTTVGKSQANGKPKRSYSQLSYHEPLQRIPSRSNSTGSYGVNSYKNFQPKLPREWHAPDAYTFDYAEPGIFATDQLDIARCTQAFWFRDIPNASFLTREQRLEIKRDNLRRQAFQYAQAQHFRSTKLAKRRMLAIIKALAKFKIDRDDGASSKCSIPTCTNEALALTAYCYLHITLNTDQRLFHPCTAKFSDNSQCRIPVFDISHELPLCREHAWKRDNYNRMLQEQKPKKTVRKKPKASAMTRPPKRNKKKKKSAPSPQPAPNLQPANPLPPLVPPKQSIQQPQIQQVSPSMDLYNHDAVMHDETVEMMSKIPISIMANQYLSDNAAIYQFAQTGLPNMAQQELFTVCENSSAYESSEDTGVGGLSESELMGASDGIEIPLSDARLLEEHDLTNVFNQLPEDAFNELFEVQQNDHYEPTQKEQEELARALEEVDEQVKSLEQMTGSTDFLGNFLDVDDEILIDDTDICGEVLPTSSVKNEMRGLVHT